MARRKKALRAALGVLIGILLSQLLVSDGRGRTDDICGAARHQRTPLPPALLEPPKSSPQERGGKGLIFVGVMTAARYLETRARAVYDTWGRSLDGRVVFFSSGDSVSDDLPLVPLPGVDDSYPPQRKSFAMLKYMYDHYIDQYEWFLRADDDVYIRTDRLEELLRSVDSKKPWFIGQTGRGNTEEFGLLSLDSDENFCMGGPGVIFSRETLKRMVPHVEECLANLVTTHEDVELGRCVRRFVGISCTWSYEASHNCTCEMQVILYHNQSGSTAFSGNLNQKEVHRAITLHPVKQPQHMYRLHKYVKTLKVQQYEQDSLKLHRDIVSSMGELGFHRNRLESAYLVENLPLFPEKRGTSEYVGNTSLLGVPQGLVRYQPKDLESVLEWELISKALYSYKDLNPRKRLGTSLKEGLNDAIRDIMELINSYSKQRGRVIDYKEVLYGYWRLDPIHGVDLILDLLLVYRKYRGHKMTVQVRRHAYVQQTFTGISVREVLPFDFPNMSKKPSTTEAIPVHKKIVKHIISSFEQNLHPLLFGRSNSSRETTINFVLPVSGRFDIFRRFLRMFEDVCVKDREAAKLFVILYRNEQTPEDFERSIELIKDLNGRISDSGSKVTSVPVEDEVFARAKALQRGVNMLEEDDLMVFIDVDMVFDSKSLVRFRRNTVKNRSLYFPIVYSLYNPRLLNRTYPVDDYKYYSSSNLVDNSSGFWRQFGFGIVSLYKSDYRNLGGFNLLISGWGFEDVNFYDTVVKSDLKIVRSVDSSLVHVYHPVNCDTSLDVAQRNMCLGTQASMLGSLQQLQKLYKMYESLFR